MCDPRLRQAPDQFEFGVERDRALFVLQAVARTDLDYSHMVGGVASGGGEGADATVAEGGRG